MTRWLRPFLPPVLMLVGLTLAGLLLRRLGLDEAIARAGERGPVVFTTLAALACAVGVPRQVVAYAGGLAFGIWPGVALAMVAELAGCAADFWWARLLARRWAVRYLWRWAWIARLERFLVANTFSATLTLRLLPVGSNIALNLLAGVSAVSAVPFLAASALGYVPQTVVFALAGGGMRMSQWLTMGLGAALLVLSVGLGIVLMRRRPIPGMGAAPSA